MGSRLAAVVGVPVTTTIRGIRTEVRVGPEDGIKVESVASLDNLQLVDRAYLTRRIGQVRASTLAAICHALEFALGCATPAESEQPG